MKFIKLESLSWLMSKPLKNRMSRDWNVFVGHKVLPQNTHNEYDNHMDGRCIWVLEVEVTKLTLNFNFWPLWHFRMFSISVAITKLYCLISLRYLLGGGGTCLPESHSYRTSAHLFQFNWDATQHGSSNISEWTTCPATPTPKEA